MNETKHNYGQTPTQEIVEKFESLVPRVLVVPGFGTVTDTDALLTLLRALEESTPVRRTRGDVLYVKSSPEYKLRIRVLKALKIKEGD